MQLPTDATLALLGHVFTTQLLVEGARYLLAAGTMWLLLTSAGSVEVVARQRCLNENAHINVHT